MDMVDHLSTTFAALADHTRRSIRAERPPPAAGGPISGSDLWPIPEGGSDESSTSAGRHTQRGVRPERGRQTRTVGSERPPLWRLGGLPSEGLAGRSEPNLRV